jgi:hypothetical protein
MNETYPPIIELNERTLKAIEMFKILSTEANLQNWKIAYMSGFAIDSHFGYFTRQHRDIDIMAPKEDMEKIRKFFESIGHEVYELDKFKGDNLKVDHADANRETQTFCDIHRFYENADGRVAVPLLGRELVFSGSFDEITEMKGFLGITTCFLKSKYIKEEKIGWQKQVGLPEREETVKEIEKIDALLVREAIT